MFNPITKLNGSFDEELYEIVANELESGEKNKGLWTKALSETGHDLKMAEALYIKLRVSKLNDERKKEQIVEEQIQKEGRNLKKKVDTLNNTAQIISGNVRYLIYLMYLAGAVALFISYIIETYYLLLVGIILISLGIYSYKIVLATEKSSDIKIIKKNLNIIYAIMIPFSILSTISGAFFPIIGIFSFIVFILLIKSCIKFNTAYSYAEKNQILQR